MKNLSSGFGKVTTALAILFVFVIAAAAAFGTYSWQHHKVNDLNHKINSLNSQVANLNNQIAIFSSQLNKTCQPAQTSSPASGCTVYSYTSPKGVNILVFTPAKSATVTSPVAIIGEVPGNWSFEAQFPVQLKNSQGAIVAQTPAHLLGNWQTTQLVPFSAQLTYASAQSGAGTIVLQKDNPSGLSTNADAVSIPIQF